MNGKHPGELQLARLSDEAAVWNAADHLGWCARCRRILADFQWLEGEVTASLEAEATAAPVPRADCGAVSSRLGRSAGHLSRNRLAFAATAALLVCVMIAAPSLLGRRVRAGSLGTVSASGVPTPVVAASTDSRAGDRVPRIRVSADPGAMVTLSFVPPPTPPDADA